MYQRAYVARPAFTSDDPLRGTGRTTRQIESAPQGAVYVWGGLDLRYVERLVVQLNRTDLVLRTKSWLDEPSRVLSVNRPLVVDHDARLTQLQRVLVDTVQARVAREKRTQ